MPRLHVAGVVALTIAAGSFAWKLAALPASDAPLVAHEWGTFTSLQDDDGTALGAINTDDEPVPDFVRSIGGMRTLSSRGELSPRLSGGKGIVACHPGVTMRLETPVIYFYPSEKRPAAPVNVRVTFRGGWLTEFYPRALAEGAGLDQGQTLYPPLTSATTGSLAWNNVELGATGKLVATDDPVWTAPREVARAAVVQVPSSSPGEPPDSSPEKFLFYRGVGHLDSPLRAVRDRNADRLNLFSAVGASDPVSGGGIASDMHVPAAWLVDIRPGDGYCAFRAVNGPLDLRVPITQALASLPAGFASGEYSAGRLGELRSAMHAALVEAGLFPDEAAAMLKTWELSYFKSPGRRLFYVTPRAWTEQVLPLTIDGARITRAMIGRIELITPWQRERLARMAAGPCPDMAAFQQEYQRGLETFAEAWRQRGAAGGNGAQENSWKQPAVRDLNISVPAIYQAYLELGRFRDALVLREQQERPTPALAAFVTGNELQPR